MADKAAVQAAVTQWFNEKIGVGAIARNTEAYNQAFLAKDDLMARLVALIDPDGGDKPAAAAIDSKE